MPRQRASGAISAIVVMRFHPCASAVISASNLGSVAAFNNETAVMPANGQYAEVSTRSENRAPNAAQTRNAAISMATA